jgi:hypothetical protein
VDSEARLAGVAAAGSVDVETQAGSVAHGSATTVGGGGS